MITGTRTIVRKLPGQEKLLFLPTAVCAILYVLGFLYLFFNKSSVLFYLLSPALCFAVVSVLRNWIGRERPYDHFGIRPVGRYQPNKKKSMPSRHAASAVAITLALLFWGPLKLAAPAVPICILVCILRIITGQHYPSDVLCGMLLSLMITILFVLLF